MSAWKLVPREPTLEMLSDAGKYADFCAKHNYGGTPDADGTWSAMLAASPDPTTNEALVERVARAIAGSAFDERDRHMWRSLALVAIRAMEEKPQPCGIADPSYRDCKNMKEVGGGFEGERYSCNVCGKSYFLDYEDMK